ncbi:hypothetical protein ACRCO3_28305 [Pseudomonas aeruginosa]|uniref:hypothetical protein n=2 Tax=Pseudomonas aeruginosa TaxID=287 RepID=UPI0005E30BAA|nr:hypothetical protein [Pseudomonas aeruginosa]EKX6767933.1 hypothetical protein [Pseudomonas aeruginosa]ELP1324922.1 hypothetical protein [Pseudomonas aeruginosa]ELW3045003.1 hypothetical protein [Pseudomonas aeruginosa]KJJ17549.1 hypothetical protein HMPREF3150_03127 [Pseudomonas aeruginosa]MBA5391518.1 hypothetical protein [Pseudomonas aeruginosa]
MRRALNLSARFATCNPQIEFEVEMKTPTDLVILRLIYKLYYEEFKNFSIEAGVENGRKSKIFVPIDCKLIATQLKVDADIVFGRLYYHMEEKYGYRRDDGSKVAFYTSLEGEANRCVNFPMLASVLAGLEEENSKAQTAIYLSLFATAVAIIAVVVTWLTAK